MLLLLKAFTTGVVDGWEQPYELTCGLTFVDNQTANEVYDHGVNLGQFMHAGFKSQPFNNE